LLAAFLNGRCQVLLFAMLRLHSVFYGAAPSPGQHRDLACSLGSRGGFKEHTRATLSISTSTGSIIPRRGVKGETKQQLIIIARYLLIGSAGPKKQELLFGPSFHLFNYRDPLLMTISLTYYHVTQ